MITFDEFIKEVDGKSLDVDGSAGVQCVDLSKYYMKVCMGIDYFSWGGSAKNLFENFEDFPQLKGKVTKIKNGKGFKPKKGDICFWNKNVGQGNGHTAIGTGEGVCENKSSDYFYSYDQNWTVKQTHKQMHNFTNFIGVLRPIDQSFITAKTVVTNSTNVVYYNKYVGKKTSLVDALDEMGIVSSFSNRRKIAIANSISGYVGTANQNNKMLSLLKAGKLIKP